jgi:HK97 family phage prohead protease
MAQKEIEKRFFNTEFRIIRKEDGALPKIEGYAAVFNSDSEDMGFIERVRSGAFKDALKISDARALFNHDPNYILGRQSNGTLTLKEDKKGLHMSVQPPDTQLIRDMVLTPIERGDITQQSFGFTVDSDSWSGLDTDKPIRTIEKVKEIYDVSPVTYPAYQDTQVALRSMDEAKKNVPVGVTPKITIIIEDEKTDTFHFTGDKRLEEAAAEISKRLDLSPMADESDNADDVPMDKKSSDTVKVEHDDIMERINKKLEDLNNENK